MPAALLNDTRAVQIGSVNASQFALVADGQNGLRVVQLISPDTVPGAQGFSPRPNPRLIATYPTHGEAIAVSRGLDRDRVVDETGGQTVVFGRRGSRPFHLNEMERFYLRSELVDAKDGVARRGSLYRVEDVISRDGKLMTKSGVFLSPLVTPTPAATATPGAPDFLPDIEPARCPMPPPGSIAARRRCHNAAPISGLQRDVRDRERHCRSRRFSVEIFHGRQSKQTTRKCSWSPGTWTTPARPAACVSTRLRIF